MAAEHDDARVEYRAHQCGAAAEPGAGLGQRVDNALVAGLGERDDLVDARG